MKIRQILIVIALALASTQAVAEDGSAQSKNDCAASVASISDVLVNTYFTDVEVLERIQQLLGVGYRPLVFGRDLHDNHQRSRLDRIWRALSIQRNPLRDTRTFEHWEQRDHDHLLNRNIAVVWLTDGEIRTLHLLRGRLIDLPDLVIDGAVFTPEGLGVRAIARPQIRVEPDARLGIGEDSEETIVELCLTEECLILISVP